VWSVHTVPQQCDDDMNLMNDLSLLCTSLLWPELARQLLLLQNLAWSVHISNYEQPAPLG
jgi:hypothetical protein